jgi:hypothetical protein
MLCTHQCNQAVRRPGRLANCVLHLPPLTERDRRTGGRSSAAPAPSVARNSEHVNRAPAYSHSASIVGGAATLVSSAAAAAAAERALLGRRWTKIRPVLPRV